MTEQSTVVDTNRQRPIAHVGLTVPDLDAAVEWYGKVLGYRPMAPSGELRAGDGLHGAIARDLWKERFTSARLAHLGSSEGGVLELFEFATPEGVSSAEFEYWRVGWSHICVVDPEIEELVATIVANGGHQISQIWTLFEGLPYRMVYTTDPWGTVVEIYTHSHAETYSGDRTTDSSQT